MAWNRSNIGSPAPIKDRPSSLRRFVSRHRLVLGWGIAGCFVCALLAVIYLGSSEHRPTTDVVVKGKRKAASVTKTLRPIQQEVKPAVNQLPVMMLRDHSELSLAELKSIPHYYYSVEDRKRIDPSYAERHERFLKEQAAIPWRTHVDRELALLLFAKNGNTGLLIPFDKKFAERFVESLKTPTLVASDDSDELKQQKRELNSIKAYLKEEMDAGKDIVQLLNDEFHRVKKLQGLQESLKKELREYMKTAESWDDVDDFIKAANIMLEKSGGGAMKLPIDLKIKREMFNKETTDEN